LKALDAEDALPVIATEIAKREFTLEDVREIFGAIDVDESETGDKHTELREKLYNLFPQVKKEHEKRDKAWELSGQRQTQARSSIAAKLANTLNPKHPMFPQIEKWVEDNYPELRDSFSDETCIAADLYRYHPRLIPKLAKELRVIAKKNRDHFYMQKKNSETWYYLSSLLERKAVWQKYEKDANGKLKPRKARREKRNA
jgi:hypothetical protein